MDRTEIFQKIAESLRADFERIKATIPHSGEKGQEFENILKDFLGKHLPKRFSVCSGFILDKNDIVSPQQDVIIYDALNAPVYSVDARNMVIPNDNVAITIEVKASLDGNDISETAQKVEKIKSLFKSASKLSGVPLTPTFATQSFVFAYGTSLNMDRIRELYAKECRERIVRGLHIDGIFILDKGFLSLALHLPGDKFGPLFIAHSAVNVSGAKVTVCSQDFKNETLDYFIRMLLPHLSQFYHRIDHPGFKWVVDPKETELYTVPLDKRNINPDVECYCTSGLKYKECHLRIDAKNPS